jgi:hypothetical protein
VVRSNDIVQFDLVEVAAAVDAGTIGGVIALLALGLVVASWCTFDVDGASRRTGYQTSCVS